jgi:uroporphyrinogen-III synthase
LGIDAEVRRALAADVAVASVGPVMTSSLEAQGLAPDIVPKHPKMASLVKAAAEEAPAILSRKRVATTSERRA